MRRARLDSLAKNYSFSRNMALAYALLCLVVIRIAISDKFEKVFPEGENMCVFEMYKIAIEGRNNHHGSYNEWVNLYSIFTGALFVAYYSIAKKGGSLLMLLIALAGTVASLCWYLSVMGYYAWILSWIGVVHDYEDELNKHCLSCTCANNNCSCQSNRFYVYGVFKDVTHDQEHVSTQKTTKFFVGFLCVMWNVLLASSLFSVSGRIKTIFAFLSNNTIVDMLLVFLMLLAVVSEVLFVTACRKRKLLSDVIDMKGTIHG